MKLGLEISLLEVISQLSLPFPLYLFLQSTDYVFIVRVVKYDFLSKSITHLPINKSLKMRVLSLALTTLSVSLGRFIFYKLFTRLCSLRASWYLVRALRWANCWLDGLSCIVSWTFDRYLCRRGQHRQSRTVATTNAKSFTTSSRQDSRSRVQVWNVCSHLFSLLSEWLSSYWLVVSSKLLERKFSILENIQLSSTFKYDLGFFHSSSTQFYESLEKVKEYATNQILLHVSNKGQRRKR